MRRLLLLAASLALSAPLLADTPNVQPGLWEISSHMTGTGFMPVEDQTSTETQCLSEEDIRNGGLMDFPLDEGCRLTGRDYGRDSASVAWICDMSANGIKMTGNGEAVMQFRGESSDGTMRMRLNTPMGEMNMNATIKARRIGDC